jgi:hypothetical protein
MVAFPHVVMPPFISIALLPLVLFSFKMSKTLFLYRKRVAATLRQSLAAGLAGLALSHTISMAIWSGLVTGKLGFYRTPKLAQAPAFVRALLDAREEALLGLAFVLAAVLVMLREDSGQLDLRVWALVLVVQAIPYWSAVVVSLISSRPDLPASLVGPMSEMRCEEQLERPAA